MITIIPEPQKMEIKNGTFNISNKTVILANEKLLPLAKIISAKIKEILSINVSINDEIGGENTISLETECSCFKEEGYILDISSQNISIKATNEKGIFYAIQTFLQLLPVVEQNSDTFAIECLKIEDEPAFKWRGLHLDVGRHIFSIFDIKKLLDLMAFYKLNTFHWHLTEDQGWRIEIKKYPKLTSIGSKRKETVIGHASNKSLKYDGKEYSGFYTQNEAKDIVNYAAKRNITVVPEIDIPGHASAVIAAYPEFGTIKEAIEVKTTWGIFDDGVLNSNEDTFNFLFDMFDEIMDIFPSKYIHIGGDEAPKTLWEKDKDAQDLIKEKGLKNEDELQSYFIKRVEKHINSKGRLIIGWDEILEGGIAPNAAIMSWRGEKGGIAAAKEKHNVVMTSNTHLYFDHYQSEDQEAEPLAIGGFLNLKKVYSYDPIGSIEEKYKKYIIGVQANLWTEYMPTFKHVEYMAFPRTLALAEIAWSPKNKQDWNSFKEKLPNHLNFLKSKNVNFRKGF